MTIWPVGVCSSMLAKLPSYVFYPLLALYVVLGIATILTVPYLLLEWFTVPTSRVSSSIPYGT